MAFPQPNIIPGPEPAPSGAAGLLTAAELRADPEIVALIEASDEYLKTIGYTDHGLDHVDRVAACARAILSDLGATPRECELTAIAGLLHDIGNVVHRDGHPGHSALMSFQLLTARAMPTREIATVMGAIGNHDESDGEPISPVSAALILADKSDVRRARVRNPEMIRFDIHDRVNYAATNSELRVEKSKRLITLDLRIDTTISQVMEYFEIFIDRMRMCRRSAIFLQCDFQLVINDHELT